MQSSDDIDAEPNAGDVVELRVLIARLEGQLDKTPGRFEFFVVTLSIVGLLTAVFAAVFFFVVQSNQRAFEVDVLKIIERREEEAQRKLEEYLSNVKGLPKKFGSQNSD